DLKAIARSEDEPSRIDEIGQGVHERRPTRDGAGTQVVAVGEASGEDQAVEPSEIRFAVPDVPHRLVEDLADHVVKIAVTPRAGEHHDAEVHRLPVSPFGFRIHSTLYVCPWQEATRAKDPSLEHLDREFLDHGVHKELRAHFLDPSARVRAAQPLEI